jgi:hypothetical protein
MIRDCRDVFHSTGQSSFASAVEQVWNLCKLRIFAAGSPEHATASGVQRTNCLHELPE